LISAWASSRSSLSVSRRFQGQGRAVLTSRRFFVSSSGGSLLPQAGATHVVGGSRRSHCVASTPLFGAYSIIISARSVP
jgi:hypothetical protein